MRSMNKLQIGVLAIGLLASATCQGQSGLMETVVVNFNGTNGQGPRGELVQRADGLLYGTTVAGGAFDQGTIFKTTLDGSLTNLFSFNGTNGAWPQSAPLLGPDGNSYGITPYGGNGFDGSYVSGQGTIYQLGSNGVLNTLFAFNGTNGNGPTSLILGDDGNLYGTTCFGGAFTNGGPFTNEVDPFFGQGDGTVFKMTTNGDFTLLASFDDTNGAGPFTLIQANDGNFYGVTQSGGANTLGTVFQMTPDGDVTTLFSFSGTNGAEPSTLVQGSDGALYGTTQAGGASFGGVAWSGDGAVFRITTNGDFTLLASLDHLTTGAEPLGKLLEVSNGVFYGTAGVGGPVALGSTVAGTLFEVTTNGLTELLGFWVNGKLPYYLSGGVIKATDGNYYGCGVGGSNEGGIYAIQPLQTPVIQASAQAGKINLTWNAWAGYDYMVLTQTNATVPMKYWNQYWPTDEYYDVSHFSVVAATNGAMSFSDVNGPDAQRFYRVVMEPPNNY